MPFLKVDMAFLIIRLHLIISYDVTFTLQEHIITLLSVIITKIEYRDTYRLIFQKIIKLNEFEVNFIKKFKVKLKNIYKYKFYFPMFCL